MNKAQKKIMIAVAIGLVITFLFPPCAFFRSGGGAIKMGYSFIANIPSGYSVHILMLFAEWLGILVLGGIAYFIAKSDSTEARSSSEQWHNQKQVSQREYTHYPNHEPSWAPINWAKIISFPNILFFILYLMFIGKLGEEHHDYPLYLIMARALGVCIIPALSGLYYNLSRNESNIAKYIYIATTVIMFVILLGSIAQEKKENAMTGREAGYADSHQAQMQPAQTQKVTPSSTSSAQDMFDRANELYKQGQYSEALPLYQQLARYSGAQISLGEMYESGKGVTKDYNQAVYWYRKAAEIGDENEKDARAALNKLISKEKNEIPYKVQTQSTQIQQSTRSSVKTLKKANKKRGDLRNCLSLGSNEAIAQCVGQN